MKQFKRIQDKNGQFRYYVNGKRVTTKKGASQYVKQNFSQLNIQNLTPTEQRSFKAKQSAEKGAADASKRLKNAYRFKGKVLDKALSKYFEILEKKQKNITEFYPNVKDYGQLLKELQKDLENNMQVFDLDDASQYGLPNAKRNRTDLENTADIVIALKEDYPGYKLIVITTEGDTITDYKQGINYIRDWETNRISEEEKETKNLAYVKITYRPTIDIINKTLTIDLQDKERTSVTPMGS